MLMQNLGAQTKSIMVFSEVAYCISRCSENEVSFVNEMLSLIKKGSFESRICISIL